MAFESALRAADGPEVWLNASVTEFAFDPAMAHYGIAIAVATGCSALTLAETDPQSRRRSRR